MSDKDLISLLKECDSMMLSAGLTEREKEVVCYRFGLYRGKFHTIEETKTVFGVDNETIKAIEAKALEGLRESDFFYDRFKETYKEDAKDKLKIFISYSRLDCDAAKYLYDILLQHNCSPWMDVKDLLPGQEWSSEIQKIVSISDIFIICLSEKSVEKRGYIQREISMALNVAEEIPEGNIFIIPVKLDQCDIPNRLSRFHWIEVFNHGVDTLMLALSSQANKLGKKNVVFADLKLGGIRRSGEHESRISANAMHRQKIATFGWGWMLDEFDKNYYQNKYFFSKDISVDSNIFLDFLANSMSLRKTEKIHILNTMNQLCQFQVDELIRTFNDELIKFKELRSNYPKDVSILFYGMLKEWFSIIYYGTSEFVVKLYNSLSNISRISEWTDDYFWIIFSRELFDANHSSEAEIILNNFLKNPCFDSICRPIKCSKEIFDDLEKYYIPITTTDNSLVNKSVKSGQEKYLELHKMYQEILNSGESAVFKFIFKEDLINKEDIFLEGIVVNNRSETFILNESYITFTLVDDKNGCKFTIPLSDISALFSLETKRGIVFV